ncbi:hypothetical protein, partial [Cohnella lupini]|uniref:hypothetical protein n=1 Tax=Cohnella lupini TaxID=1294267 RepID=UPI001C6E0E2E
KKNIGKPDEGKLHVRFDAGGAGKVKGGHTPSNEISVLYSTQTYMTLTVPKPARPCNCCDQKLILPLLLR